MADVNVGDRVTRKICYGDGGSLLPAEEGTVVYVHPEGRFYTLEFNFPKGRFRESYLLPPDPSRLAPDRPTNAHLWGSHYKRESRVALGKYLETM